MKILAVTSGKGGVGKTTLALNIARQLSLHGCRTLIIDLDIHNKGATGLFLDRIDESTYSIIRITEDSDQFEKPAKEIAKLVTPLTLDKDGNLLFIPAAKPKDLIRWKKFISANDRIVRFFRDLIHELAKQHDIDCVVIDCYGGIDTLTVAAAGIADDTILINEPDIITFSGTLMLYTYLADTYKESEYKPNLHFVINRITSRHSFYFLEREYRKHLSELAVTKSILSYLPYDKLVMEAFGDYPFFTELLPRGLLTRKIHLLICSLWKDSAFAPFSKLSKRENNRIFRKIREHPFADPERILRTLVSVPFLLIVPFAILFLLSVGPVESLHYRSIQIAYSFSIYMLILLFVLMAFFEPLQMTRWLLRVENYKRRLRHLGHNIKRLVNVFISGLGYSRAIFPILVGGLFSISLIVAVVLDEDSRTVLKPNLGLWPKTIYGFKPNRNYSGLQLRSGAAIEEGTNMRKTVLDGSDLAYTTLSGIDFTGSSIDSVQLNYVFANKTLFDSVQFRKARLNNSLLMGSSFIQSTLNSVDLRNADMTGSFLKDAKIDKSDLNNVFMISADLTNTVIKDSDLSGAYLNAANLDSATIENTDLTNCVLTGADLRSTTFKDSKLEGAVLYKAKLAGNTTLLPRALSYALASGCSLDMRQKDIARSWENEIRDSGFVWPEWLKGLGLYSGGDIEYLIQRYEKEIESLDIIPDLVELCLISGSPQNMSNAKKYLADLNSRVVSQYDDSYGIMLSLELLYEVIQGNSEDAERSAADEYLDWIRRYGRFGGLSYSWSWEFWNSNFPYHRYLREQNMKLRAVILVSEGRDKAKALAERLFAINHHSE